MPQQTDKARQKRLIARLDKATKTVNSFEQHGNGPGATLQRPLNLGNREALAAARKTRQEILKELKTIRAKQRAAK